MELVVEADFTPPLVTAAFVPILGDGGVRGDDPFFILVNADDATGTVDTGIASVTARLPDGSTVELAEVGDVESVI